MKLKPLILIFGVLIIGGLMNEAAAHTQKTEIATFGGGCFWCMEPPYREMGGVISVTAGYMGGHTKNPTYEEVCSGETGHAEVVQIVFDPAVTSYEKMLDIFWRNIDPTTANRQFADVGSQYRTVIFYVDETQKQKAVASKEMMESQHIFKGPIVTQILPASTFYAAEGYHQCYYKKNPMHYKLYRQGSGRSDYLEKLWGDKENKANDVNPKVLH